MPFGLRQIKQADSSFSGEKEAKRLWLSALPENKWRKTQSIGKFRYLEAR
jgi:hypothetical protein